MDFVTPGMMFSRQGRATLHMFPHLLASHKAKKKRKVQSPDWEDDNSEEPKTEEEPAIRPSPSAAFKAVSREKYEYTFRNRTESPSATAYTPKTDIVTPRRDRSPAYRPASAHQPRLRTSKNQCSRRLHETEESGKSPLKDAKIRPAETFGSLKSRAPFVKDTDGAHEGRFAFNPMETVVYSKPQTAIDMTKTTGRSELFQLGLSISTYNKNEEFTMPRTVTYVPCFARSTGHRPLLNEQELTTPQPREAVRLQNSLKHLESSHGPVNIPLMRTLTARDDAMYRTIEMYTKNVPCRQSATSVPKFMGGPLFSSRLKPSASARTQKSWK